MSNQKGFSKVAIIIIVLILIGGAYFVFSKKDKNIPAQNTENKNSQLSQSIDGDLSMNNWKAYRNDQYGFEFKYPTNWYGHPGQNPKGISVLLLKTKELPNLGGTETYAYGDQIVVKVSDLIGRYDKKLSKEEYIQENFPDDGFGGDVLIIKKWVNINNVEMLRVEQTVSGASGKTLEYIYFKNDKSYSFYLYPYDTTNGSMSARNLEDFEKLVSTFKFTN